MSNNLPASFNFWNRFFSFSVSFSYETFSLVIRVTTPVLIFNCLIRGSAIPATITTSDATKINFHDFFELEYRTEHVPYGVLLRVPGRRP